jgi:hypothetical protein
MSGFSGRNISSEDKLFILGLLTPVFVVPGYLLYRRVLVPLAPFSFCIWDRFFGIYCPGCGGTRAVEALLNGDIIASLQYHPIVLYSSFIYIFYMFGNILHRISGMRIFKVPFHSRYLYIALFIIIANCLIRNFLRFRFGITI